MPCTGTPAESNLQEFMASFWPENELCELLCISLFCPANSEVIADCHLINVSEEPDLLRDAYLGVVIIRHQFCKLALQTLSR